MDVAVTLPSLTDTLQPWGNFFSTLGEGSATMIGLLFVAVSITSGVFSGDRPEAMRVFLTASVVHFTSILAVSLIVLAPHASWMLFAGMVLCCGLFGLGYSGVACHSTMRTGLYARIDLEDRTWYMLLPVIAYLAESLSAVTLAIRPYWGCAGLAVSVGLLLLTAVHNAWDITLWSTTRQR
jgi:hypothetical protein